MIDPTAFKRFDVLDYLSTEEDRLAYFEAALEEDDPDFVLTALGDIARARSFKKIEQATGLDRDGLLEALQSGSTTRQGTLQKIMNALDLKLGAEAFISKRTAAE
jgi:probable addiction module antidote protein